jgi:hypothetical protein
MAREYNESQIVPGGLKPRAVEVVNVLFRARDRMMSAWTIAKRIGDDDALHIVPLLHDMRDLGLVERHGKSTSVGYRRMWRLLVSGPIAILFAIFIAACAAQPAAPHEIVSCKGWPTGTVTGGGPPSGQCELACESPPPTNGPDCATTWLAHCQSFVAFDGTPGCCFIAPTLESPMRFFECLQ